MSRRLADIHPCQAVHANRKKYSAHSNEPPGGSGLTARRFLARNLEIAKTTQ